MKVELNLASLPSHRERYALAWTLPLLLAAILGLAFFAPLAVRNLREHAKVQREVERLRKERALVAGKEKDLRARLDRPASRRIAQEAVFVNGLIEAKSLSVTGLAERVSSLMPATARLKGLSLAFQQHQPVVRFSVTGKDETSVEDFLSNLENSQDFQDVTIENEGFETGGPGEPIQVVFTARYVAGDSARGAKH